MKERTNRQWVLKQRPIGQLTENCFERQEATLPKIKDGQVLGRNLLLSFDASQRVYTVADSYVPMVKIGEVMRAFGIAQVLESKHRKFKPGQLFISAIGWQDYCLIEPDTEFFALPLVPLSDPATMLALSLTGLTGYFGMLRIGQPRPGETVVVSGAAGATGSIAGQVAKLKGCRVIGIAGGKDKCSWLVDKLHFDAAIDYKHEDVDARIAALCPKGIDVYYDNVGGKISETVYQHLALSARIIMCGAISAYDSGSFEPPRGPDLSTFIIKGVRAEGFLVTKFMSGATAAMLDLTTWIREGKLIQAMDVQQGFDNIPKTLLRLFSGANYGKQLLKLAEPELPVPQQTLVRAGLRAAQTLRKLFAGSSRR